MEPNNQINNSFENLVSKLKNEDTRYARLSKGVGIVYWILIPVYLLLTFLEYRELKATDVILSGSCFIVAFLIFVIFFRKYYKDYKYVDYSLPTVQMLKKAVWRYRPFQLRSLWILLAIVLMNVGLTVDWLNENISILLIQIVFWSIFVFAILIGLIVWYFKYKPIHDEASRLLKEIKGE